MWIAFNFRHASICIARNLECGHETKTYIAWLERLKLYCFLTAHNADRWPIDLVSLQGKLRSPNQSMWCKFAYV